MTNRYAIIENDIVVNVVDADAGYAEQQGWIACDTAGIGWIYSNNTFFPPTIDLEQLKNERKNNIMIIRDTKIDSGITFEGHEFQTRQADRENVAGASQLATLWLMNGGDPNSLRWADPDNDFVWIDLYNQLQPMTAMSMINFGKALATMKRQCIFHALSLKEAIDAATTEEEIRAVDITVGWP